MKWIGHLFVWFTMWNCLIVFAHHQSRILPSLAAMIGPHIVQMWELARSSTCMRERSTLMHQRTPARWFFWGTLACSRCHHSFLRDNLYYTIGIILYSGISSLRKSWSILRLRHTTSWAPRELGKLSKSLSYLCAAAMEVESRAASVECKAIGFQDNLKSGRVPVRSISFFLMRQGTIDLWSSPRQEEKNIMLLWF